MPSRAIRLCPRAAIVFSAFSLILGGAIVGRAVRARGRTTIQPYSISALPTATGPDQSSPSADYVRKTTDPPRFDPKSVQAVSARKRAEATRRS